MSGDDGSERLPSVSRRELLAGTGVLATGVLGGLYGATHEPATEPRFLLRQGLVRYEVTPVSYRGETVETFYGYEDTDAHPAVDVVAENDASRLLLYEGPVGTSLVFLHGARDVTHGGTATFTFSGLSRERGEWAVRDDPRRIADDFEPWDGGNQRVAWEWGAGDTDGGAFWGGFDREEFEVVVTPKTLTGVDSWRFLSGELDDLDRYDLAMDRPVTLRPARGRTVKQVAVDVMPDESPNVFDPYANDRIVVAVEPPPADADPDAWVDPGAVDPGNYTVAFGSKSYLAGGNGAQPQNYRRRDGTLFLEYTVQAANFDLDDAHGYLVGKTGEKTFFRGRDTVQPGGFENA